MATLEELFADYEQERLKEIKRLEAYSNTAAEKARKAAERQREIKQGLRDSEPNDEEVEE